MSIPACASQRPTVALLAEGVDRNSAGNRSAKQPTASPSSRRAWIEMDHLSVLTEMVAVALLAEGVDRNM